MKKEIRQILKKINWDYDILLEDIYNCLKGKTDRAGFYSADDLVVKMLEHLYWYDIIKIIPLNKIKLYLTKKNIKRIYPKELQVKYEFLRKLLSDETVSASGWNNKSSEFPKISILSDRWYSFKQRIL